MKNFNPIKEEPIHFLFNKQVKLSLHCHQGATSYPSPQSLANQIQIQMQILATTIYIKNYITMKTIIVYTKNGAMQTPTLTQNSCKRLSIQKRPQPFITENRSNRQEIRNQKQTSPNFVKDGITLKLR